VAGVWHYAKPYPSLIDLLYAVSYPLFIIGILRLPAKAFSPAQRLKAFLDMSIAIIAAFLAFWVLIIGPAIAANESDLVTLIASLAHPVLDLLITFALLGHLFRPISSSDRMPLTLLALSSLVWIVTDLLYVLQSIEGTYLSGGFSDIGSMATYLLIALAGVSRDRSIWP
jgi:two-component system, sensor histidine kinase PdtaS